MSDLSPAVFLEAGSDSQYSQIVWTRTAQPAINPITIPGTVDSMGHLLDRYLAKDSYPVKAAGLSLSARTRSDAHPLTRIGSFHKVLMEAAPARERDAFGNPEKAGERPPLLDRPPADPPPERGNTAAGPPAGGF